MATASSPQAALSVLPRADGSVTYSYLGYTVTASANGPIEAQRRDEHPYEAHVDVVVRPAAGVGGTRERHLETLLQSSLSQIILVKNFPRSLIQIVLQIEATPTNDYANTKLAQAGTNIPALPALLHTAILALLSASVPLAATATATSVAIIPQGGPTSVVVNPTQRDLAAAKSVHVLGFTSDDSLLLTESEGDFTMEEWDEVYEAAQSICCKLKKDAGMDMASDDAKRDGADMQRFLRSTMEAKVSSDLHWK